MLQYRLFIILLTSPAIYCLPNIVVFIADDLGYGDIGCFGNTTIRTPNIDRIAKDGAILTHHIAAEAVCTPSRAALLTGRYPIRYGLASPHKVGMPVYVAGTSGLPSNETTFAEILKEQGYSTGFVGKWHLGLSCNTLGDHCQHPLNQGFDSFYGIPLTNMKDFGDENETVTLSAYPLYQEFMLATMAVTIVTSWLMLRYKLVGWRVFLAILILTILFNSIIYLFINNGKKLNSMVLRNHAYVEQPIRFLNFTERLVREGITFLNNRQNDKNPLLLVMSWLQVHTVLHASSRFRGQSSHGRYGDEVEEMDWSVGEIMGALEALGFSNNTFVYFTSDNGGHVEETGVDGDRQGGSNGIFRGGKGQGGMEGGIRVPAVAMWPGHIPPGHVVNQPTSMMDMFPTIINIAGGQVPSDRTIDGKNLVPLLTGSSQQSPHQFLFHYCGMNVHSARYISPSGDEVWKLHYTKPNWLPGTEGCSFICSCYGDHTWLENPLLFELTSDPSEERPVDMSAKYQDIVQTINRAVSAHANNVTEVTNQMSLWKMAWRPWLQPCCNFPYCDCQDETYSHS